jgi:hypothetical protein
MGKPALSGGATVPMNLPVLRQRMQMHARLQGGALYIYDILNEAGETVGALSVRLDKKKRTETRTYTLGDRELTSADDFRRAYQQKLNDDEFDAAAPPQEGTDND